MTKIDLRRCASSLAIAAALAGAAATAPTTALAQPAAGAAAAHAHFDIPPGPLSGALNCFAEVTGIQLVYTSDLVQGRVSPGVSGDLSPREALQRLVAGTGLVARMLSPSSATLEAPVAGARTLGAVQVEGVQTDVFTPTNGFGPGAGANGSSDSTATEGTGSLTTNGATIASKAPQALKDTPQTVTVITQERIQQQDLTDLTSALNYAPGVTLLSQGSIGTEFISRGFQITTFQIDGGGSLGLGFNNSYITTPNLAEFDNVQVLRGSDALFGGAGQPGGVVSLDRKRPLDHEQITGEIDAGSWDNFLGQADATGPIGFDGHLRARLVVSDQDRDFFYDEAHENVAFVYGVAEADLGPDTLVRAGFSYEQQRWVGLNNTGLPRYSNGQDLNLSRSTNFAPSWSRATFETPEVFAAIEHKFNQDWNIKLNFTRQTQNSNQLYASDYGYIVQGSPLPSHYNETQANIINLSTVQYAADATINGSFTLFGLKQSVTVGGDYSNFNSTQIVFAAPQSIPINVFSFNRSVLNPLPTRFPPYIGQPIDAQVEWGGYASINLQPIRNFHVIAGLRVSDYQDQFAEEYYFGSPKPIFGFDDKNDSSGILTPYAAATYGLTPEVTMYASYADIYQAQGLDVDPTGKPLPPITGDTYEAGVKGAFRGGRLNASLAIFYTDESNQAVPYADACQVGNSCYLAAGAVISQGVDLEMSGEIQPGWQVQAGYTYDENKYNAAFLDAQFGNGINSTYQTQQPKHQVKLWTSYTPTGRFSRWTVGGGLRLESARFTAGNVCTVQLDPTTGNCATNVFLPFAFTQGLYSVIDLRAAYKLNDHWQAALNVTNIGDTRYYATAGTSGSGNYYGEPRAVMFSIRAKY